MVVDTALFGILVSLALVCDVQVQTASVDSCPMFGCRPSGTFSYVLHVTPKVSLAWPKSFIQGPLANSLGCSANDANVVCQANGLRQTGYVTLFPMNGTVAWYGDILRRPTLPIMDIYGDVIGTDGHSLVMYTSDGKIVKPQINLGDNLYPTYSLTLSEENNIIAIVSRQGFLITKESNGVPHASMQFRAEEERTNGTFLPVAPPVVSGHRIYILTEFRPDYDSQSPDILGMQRLFAIDMKNVMMGRLEIAWIYNFERLDDLQPLVRENQKETLGGRREALRFSGSGGEPQVMVNSNTDMVYVNLPPPEAATNAPHLLWGFKDEPNGTSPNLIFKIPQSLSKFAMFETNKGRVLANKREKNHLNQPFRLSKSTDKASLWGVSIDKKLILKLNPDDGTVIEDINLDSLLNMTSSIVTSKLMVARNMNTAQDILIFGVQALSSNNQKKDSRNNASQTSSTNNYVVSLTEKKVNWMIATPSNREVRGQIAGVQSSANGSDMLVVFTSDSEESEIFALKFDN